MELGIGNWGLGLLRSVREAFLLIWSKTNLT